jgi:AraC-like DNA-binding protein
MKLAARELGISERSLRRRLEDEGSSFRAVTQTVLEETARSMLRNPDLTVHETSYALGFARPTAFHRAFKRWTGITPVQYRADALAVSRRSQVPSTEVSPTSP